MVNLPNIRNHSPFGKVFPNRVRSARLAGRLIRGLGKAVLLIGLCFVMIYPILFILSSGFKSLEDIYNPSVVWIPQQFSLEAMNVAVQILDYPKALLKTVTILVPSVLLQLVTVLRLWFCTISLSRAQPVFRCADFHHHRTGPVLYYPPVRQYEKL